MIILDLERFFPPPERWKVIRQKLLRRKLRVEMFVLILKTVEKFEMSGSF